MHKSVRFEIYGFKNPAIWLVECIYSILLQTWSKNVLTVTWKPDFLQACSFCRIMKMTITHYVKLKKINTLDFWLFWPMWGKFLDFSSKIFFFFFPEKSNHESFLPRRHSNFTCNFRKTLWAILEKIWLLNDLLNDWLTLVIS